MMEFHQRFRYFNELEGVYSMKILQNEFEEKIREITKLSARINK